jgi:DNA repair ATPase RecN
MDTLETLNTKIEKHDNMIRKITQVFDQNNTGYKQNFDIIRNQFSKIEHMMKMQDNVVEQQESTIRKIEQQIEEINNLVSNLNTFYYTQNDMNERIRSLEGLFTVHGLQLAKNIIAKKPPSGMYTGGYKTRKSFNKRRKTSKIK